MPTTQDLMRSVDATNQRFVDILFPKKEQESLSPIAKQVMRIERQAENLLVLTGEILATLTLGENQYLFEHAPEDWHVVVKSWSSRYDCLKTEEAK